MTLEELGFDERMAKYGKEQHLDSFLTGRVTSEHKERYIVKTLEKNMTVKLLGI
ncbi:hypothetical protein [Algoriphagus sp. PAP.12]|uniref:hypothetical protein n=1 Tax=Algoriphagus sp. PAP.12 TaxID=2996678 RepID=UPI00227C68AD|nr:hypothetical protein [Algoriphagus sp. PAP.12]